MTKDEALKMAIEAMDDSMIVCENLHHAKKDQHKYNEKCPVEKRWMETINACKEALQTNALDEMQKVTEKEYYQETKQGIELEWYVKGWDDALKNKNSV